MAESINWNFVTQAVGGPSVSAAGSIEVEAYDKLTVTIPTGSSQTVNLAPNGDMSLLVVNPTTPAKGLSYKVGSAEVSLDGPHILIGAGAVSLLGKSTSLKFTNNTGTDAVIGILIGRDATP